MTARLQELDEIEASIWSELEQCVAVRPRAEPGETDAGEPPHEWRVAVLATVDDGQADARSLVLREVDAAERRLVFYTDARSPKVRQIEQSPQGTLIFYSRKLGQQLRMQVRLNVETAGLAVSSRWAKLQTRPARATTYPSPPRAARSAPRSGARDRGHGRDGRLAGAASGRHGAPARRAVLRMGSARASKRASAASGRFST